MKFFDIVNIYGLIFAVLLALPHIIYRRRHRIDTGVYQNRAMYYIDRMGRFGSLFLMSFNIGILEKGFTEPKILMERFWLISTAVMTLCYLLIWLMFYKNEKKTTAYALAFISAFIIVFSGILQVKTLLFTFGLVYLAGELYVISRFFQNKT